MKERPILFSAPMVRAILDGSKTQTRRVYKNRKHPDTGRDLAASELVREAQHVVDRICPYGQAGDRLWVKETWFEVGAIDPGLIVYRADYPEGVSAEYQTVPLATEIKWKSSLFMRRTASRVLLEIVGVRVERLQDISQADARAEGAPSSHYSFDVVSRQTGYADFPRSWYAQLWDQINGAGSWNRNPWVWVVEFRRIA